MSLATLNEDASVLIIGESHTAAIARAVAVSGHEGVAVLDVRTLVEKNDRSWKQMDSELLRRLKPKKVFCTFGGTEHNIIGLIEAVPPIDFFTMDEDVMAERRTIPFSLMRTLLLRLLSGQFQRMERIKAIYDCEYMQISAPPPFRDLEEGILPKKFREDVHRGVAPPSVRKKIYRLHSDLVRHRCGELGFGFLEPPQSSVDQDGFLKKRFWDRDPTHGNINYGALVLSQIQDLR